MNGCSLPLWCALTTTKFEKKADGLDLFYIKTEVDTSTYITLKSAAHAFGSVHLRVAHRYYVVSSKWALKNGWLTCSIVCSCIYDVLWPLPDIKAKHDGFGAFKAFLTPYEVTYTSSWLLSGHTIIHTFLLHPGALYNSANCYYKQTVGRTRLNIILFNQFLPLFVTKLRIIYVLTYRKVLVDNKS